MKFRYTAGLVAIGPLISSALRMYLGSTDLDDLGLTESQQGTYSARSQVRQDERNRRPQLGRLPVNS